MSPGTRFPFQWVVARKHVKDISGNLGCKHRKVVIFHPPPPTKKKGWKKASSEQPSINGFQLLYAGDWVMVLVLYGPFSPRCVSAAVWGPDLGHDWALCDGTATAVKWYFHCETTLSVKVFSGLTFELRIVARILLRCCHAEKSQSSPAAITFGLQLAFLLLLIPEGIIGLKVGPVQLTNIPHYMAKISAWTQS